MACSSSLLPSDGTGGPWRREGIHSDSAQDLDKNQISCFLEDTAKVANNRRSQIWLID